MKKFTSEDDKYILAHYVTDSVEEIADALGRSPDAIKRRFNMYKREAMQERHNGSDTLCWFCQRAANKGRVCSWADRFEPVEGWQAIEVIVRSQDGTIPKPLQSYKVIECPLFVPDIRVSKL